MGFFFELAKSRKQFTAPSTSLLAYTTYTNTHKQGGNGENLFYPAYAFIYDIEQDTITLTQTFTPPLSNTISDDAFGTSVSISEGGLLAIGNPLFTPPESSSATGYVSLYQGPASSSSSDSAPSPPSIFGRRGPLLPALLGGAIGLLVLSIGGVVAYKMRGRKWGWARLREQEQQGREQVREREQEVMMTRSNNNV